LAVRVFEGNTALSTLASQHHDAEGVV
jgi:hypothetical protein